VKDPFITKKAKLADSRDVAKAFAQWPELAKKGSEISLDVKPEDFRRILILGMGGSAAAGDILAGWLHYERGVEVEVCKGMLPPGDLSDCFAIACSASGNTEETLTMMENANRKRISVVSMSYGGKLAIKSKAMNIPHVQMPQVLAPRYILPFMVFASIELIDLAFSYDSAKEVAETIKAMREANGSISRDAPLAKNPSKRLALRLMIETPAIYGTRATRGPGIRFKNEINENAKRHAYFDEMPELFHNEIQAWEAGGRGFFPIFLRDRSESERESRLADAFFEILSTMSLRPVSVSGTGDSLLSRLMTMLYQLELASYYAAVGAGRDPFPTPLIVKLKNSF
jgi:glucose/mannose-6-phosphate isomerase